MWCWRTFSFLALAGLSVSIVAAFRKQPDPPAAPPPVYPLRPNSGAGHALNRAIAALGPARTQWLRLQLREQVHAAPLSFQVEGTFQSGPDHRLRLDLQVRTDRVCRCLQLGSNGRTFWQLEAPTPDGGWQGFTLDWRQPGEPRETTDNDALLRAEVTRSYWFSGPEHLLLQLRDQVSFTRCDRLRWRDRAVVMLSGARKSSSGGTWEMYRPRQCRLVLAEESHWPLRVEWWGPTPHVQGDLLLMQLDLEQPLLNQPLPDAVFQLPATSGQIEDRTKTWQKKLADAPTSSLPPTGGAALALSN